MGCHSLFPWWDPEITLFGARFYCHVATWMYVESPIIHVLMTKNVRGFGTMKSVAGMFRFNLKQFCRRRWVALERITPLSVVRQQNDGNLDNFDVTFFCAPFFEIPRYQVWFAFKDVAYLSTFHDETLFGFQTAICCSLFMRIRGRSFMDIVHRRERCKNVSTQSFCCFVWKEYEKL